MTPKEEIKFWKKAIKLIQKQYGGHHCKPINRDYRCAGCWSGMAISWMEAHIDVIEWKTKK